MGDRESSDADDEISSDEEELQESLLHPGAMQGTRRAFDQDD